MANSTTETIIGRARDIIRAESTSDVPVIGDTFMLKAVSDGNLKWARAFQTTGSAPISFQRETGFDLIADTAINDSDGIATTDTTIVADSVSNFATSGVIVIWDDNMPDIVSYTGKSGSTTFTGVTGIGFAHEDNDVIEALYALPSTFGAFRKSSGYGDGVRLDGTPLYFIGGPPSPGYFSMYDDGTTKFLWLPRDSTGTASVFFDKASATIDSIDDTVDVPPEADFFLIWHVVAFCYIGREGDAGKMLYAQNESNKILQEFLRSRNIGKKVRTRPFGRAITDYIVKDGFLYPLY